MGARGAIAHVNDLCIPHVTKLGAFLGATVGGWIGWYLGAFVGTFTAFIISIVGTGFGMYAGRRFADQWM